MIVKYYKDTGCPIIEGVILSLSQILPNGQIKMWSIMNWPKNSLVFCWLWFLDKPMHIGLIDRAKIFLKLFISWKIRFELISVVRIPSKNNIFTSIPFDLSNQIRLKILFTCTFAITALKITCFGDDHENHIPCIITYPSSL